MRVVLVITNLQGGGAEKAMLKIAQLLTDINIEVHFIVLENIINYKIPNGVVLHKLSENTKTTKGFLGKYLVANKLARQLKIIGKYNAIISSLPFADEICKLAKVKNWFARIADSLSVEIEKITNLKKAARRYKKYQAIYNNANLIAVSKGVANDLVHKLNIKPKTLAIVNNYYDFDFIKTKSLENININFKYILHIGRLSSQKRQDIALKAWGHIAKKTPMYKLMFITDDTEKLLLMAKEHDIEDEVVILGFQDNPYAYMRNADLLILCSDHEGLPNVLIEALICGTPVISTNCPSGPEEILQDYTECLIETGNAYALSNAILHAISQDKISPQVNLERYSKEAVSQKWLKLVEGL